MAQPDASAAQPGAERSGPDALRAAGVAHDVNQMLAVIIGRAELLLRQPAAPRAHLQAILLAARDAGVMLERLGGGAGTPAGAPSPPAAAARRAVDEAASLVLPPDGAWADGAGVPGRWTLDNRIGPATAMALPAPVLREILANLLLNALGALPDGGRIAVEAVVEPGAGGDRVCLRVADSGPGLPVADPEQVFTAGYTSSGRAGRGIGLAACRQLAAAHGGTLTARARGGPGAVFTVAAPAAPAPAAGGIDDGRAVAASSAAAAARDELAGLAVVVVDDEAAVRDMLTDVLGELGCRVTCHRDGASALAAGAPGEAAVALVDRRLPGLDGVEVAARLRERRPSLVVVVMTGWDRDEAAVPASAADFTVRKPLGMGALQDLLARAAALHEARGPRGADAPGGS